jgi:hypothetical protein
MVHMVHIQLTSSPGDAAPISRFLQLLPDIRNLIYREVLVSPDEVKVALDASDQSDPPALT